LFGQVKKGILFSIAAYACYSFAAFLVKRLILPFPIVVFARNFIGFLIFLPLFLRNKDQLKTKRLGFHCARSCLSLATIYCSTYGIQRLQLGDAILLEQTAPFFIPIILFLWNKEKISRLNCAAIFFAFIGASYILQPHLDVWHLSAIASLGAGFLAALCIVCMQRLAMTETVLATLFYFLFVSTLLSIGPAASVWSGALSIYQWTLLLCIGIFFALFQFLLTKALVFANASVVGSYTYFTVVFSIVLGIVFLAEEMTFARMMGSFLIIGSGLFIFFARKKNNSTSMNADEVNE